MSLRTRLLLALGAVALVSLVIADVVTYKELESFLYSRTDQSLETLHIPIEGAVSGFRGQGGGQGQNGPPGSQPLGSGGARPFTGQACQAFRAGLAPGTYIEVRTAANVEVAHCSVVPYGSTSTPAPVLPKRITGFEQNAADLGEPATYFNAPSSSPGGFRVRASILRSGPYSGGELIVAVPLSSTVSTLNRLLDVELVVTAGALLAAALLGWWLVRLGMRPLRAIEQTADAIAAGELDQRVPGEQRRTEVGHLARALNVMLGRIEHAFALRDRTEADLRNSEARMRQFVADASHELRTPLAAVSAYAELFGRGASGRPEDLRRVMGGITEETARMGHLVEDLLLLARLDEGRPLDLQSIELVEIAAESMETARAVGPDWPVRLEATEPVEVRGDRARLRQVLDNLLSNVRAHTPEGTSAVIEVRRSGTDAILSVSDSGPGLREEQTEHVFERFYRADTSRSRSHGGAGLGLAIVASIIEAHGGQVSAEVVEGGGTTFQIRIPLAVDGEEPPAPSEPATQFTGGS